MSVSGSWSTSPRYRASDFAEASFGPLLLFAIGAAFLLRLRYPDPHPSSPKNRALLKHRCAESKAAQETIQHKGKIIYSNIRFDKKRE